jgi:hypothetical protein
VWTPWQQDVIRDVSPPPIAAIRNNDYARVVMAHLACLAINSAGASIYLNVVPGWTYTNSHALGESSGGTASAPVRSYYRNNRGAVATNATTWLKLVNTWTSWGGGTLLTKVACYYSLDNQSSYVPAVDENGYYVLSLSFYPGVKATAVVTGVTKPTDGLTITLGAKTYTFKTTLTPTEGQVLIGAALDNSLLNLINAVNHTGTPNTDYKCAVANPDVVAGPAVLATHVVDLTAAAFGAAGNSLGYTIPAGMTATQTWAGGTDQTADLLSTSWGNA